MREIKVIQLQKDTGKKHHPAQMSTIKEDINTPQILKDKNFTNYKQVVDELEVGTLAIVKVSECKGSLKVCIGYGEVENFGDSYSVPRRLSP